MFGLGGSEMVLIGIVALIVIGPKDLPALFKTMGEFTGKARVMAREFTRAMEQAADESGVKDISKTVKAAANPQKFGLDKLSQATGLKSPPDAPELSPERQAAKDRMLENGAKLAKERQAAEAAKAEAEAEAGPVEAVAPTLAPSAPPPVKDS